VPLWQNNNSMQIEQTPLKDCYIINDTVFADDRGYFFESFNQQKFKQLTGFDISFVQDNQSKSTRGVLRGLHFQQGIHAQSKLVRVIEGSVLDVAVDLRKNSPSFAQHFAIELSATNHKQLFVPKGFAHGFIVLSNTATFVYKCDNFYNKASEGGIIYNDKNLAINWQISENEILVSEKDIQLPSFNEAMPNIAF
jgi:dTDP-4-dehydrorhamnose 3,5-epimerase